MPKITFKEPKRKKEQMNEPVPIASDEEYMRNVSLPVNDEILEEVEMDQLVVVTIIGTVTSMRNHTSNDYNDKSITVKASSIEVYEHDEDEDAGMKVGYRRS